MKHNLFVHLGNFDFVWREVSVRSHHQQPVDAVDFRASSLPFIFYLH